MKVLTLLFSEFNSRWTIVKSTDSTRSHRIFALLEIFCFPVSVLSILLLVIQLTLAVFKCSTILPGWWVRYVSPILLAGAVGYLTNWLAIMMLFRPYTPRKWLFFWPQGMIPRNKPNIAKAFGHEVGHNLLPPEKIVAELSEKVTAFLNKPEIISEIKTKVQNFLHQNQDAIVNFLIPKVEQTLIEAIDRLVTPENIKSFWDKELQPRLESDETKAQIASYIVRFGQEHAGTLSLMIRQKLQQHLNNQLHGLPGAGLITGFVINFFADPVQMRQMIQDWLGEDATQNMLREKLQIVGTKLDEWLQSDEAKGKMDSFTADSRNALKNFLTGYLRESLPVFAKNALESESLWIWFESDFIPKTRANLLAFIKEHEQEIVDALQLDKRIENAINEQDVKKFHQMINHIAAEHLGAIQVLGYVLGIIIGSLQLVQSLFMR